MGKFPDYQLLVILLIVSGGLCPILAEASGQETLSGLVDGYKHLAIKQYGEVGVRYSGWFRAESNPVDFFIICAEDLQQNWTYSIGDTYNNQSGMQGEFYFVIPYSGEWMFCCYNPNSETQDITIHVSYYTSEDDTYFAVQILLVAVVIAGVGFWGWRYKVKERRIESEADIFS